LAVLIDAVRIATSSSASRISAPSSLSATSAASSVNRNQYSAPRSSLFAIPTLWMKSARLSAPRASS
jgi:hypothetical protein